MENKKLVLVAEDEKILRDALRLKLVSEGFSVLEAKNGEEGLEIALKEKPDLMLVDIVMPVMDGLTMLQKIYEIEKFTNKKRIERLRNKTSKRLIPLFAECTQNIIFNYSENDNIIRIPVSFGTYDDFDEYGISDDYDDYDYMEDYDYNYYDYD